MTAPSLPIDKGAGVLAITVPTPPSRRPALVERPPERGDKQAEPALGLVVQLDRSTRRVTVRGELDMATVPVLAEAMAQLLDLNPGDSVIDIAGVSFIDAAGLGCLVAHSELLAAIGAKITIVGALPRLRRIFDIVNLGDLLGAS